MNREPPESVRRVAELASKLAAIDPHATEWVRELFNVFSEVQEHFRKPELIETAPHEPGAPIFLFCPSQRGWQVGVWSPDQEGRWVASIDETKILEPTHWMRPAADPESQSPPPEQETA